MKRGLALALALLLTALPALCMTSCLAGAGRKSAHVGERDGVYYFYHQDRGLLIVKTGGTVPNDAHIYDLSFADEVRTLYFSGGVTSVGFSRAAQSFPHLEKMIFREKGPDLTGGDGIANEALRPVAVEEGAADFEERGDENGAPLGHCPHEKLAACILCGENCVYEFKSLYVYVKLKGETQKNFTGVFEGAERHFGEDGKLICEGFAEIGGCTRFFKENRMITGSADLDGVRYTFNTDGELTASRTIDKAVPFYLFLPAIAAIPVGALCVYGVYVFYKKRREKEESEGN